MMSEKCLLVQHNIMNEDTLSTVNVERQEGNSIMI